MEILVKAAQLIMSLSILVLLHEFGHFAFAKLFKTRVEKFYLFFNPKFSLFKFKKGETEYGIGWLPLGGYVKISGMIDESMDRDQMKEEAKPWEFRSKPAWQRLLIMIGGVLVNFILAFFIFSMVLFAWGDQYLPNENAKYGYVFNDTFKEIGFKDGDKILKIGDEVPFSASSIISDFILNIPKEVVVERNNQRKTIAIPDDFIAKLIKISNKDVKQSLINFRFKCDVIIADFAKESPALNAGMLKGDKIIRINNQPIVYRDDLTRELNKSVNKTVNFTVLRNNKEIDLPLAMGEKPVIGIAIKEFNIADDIKFKTLEYGFWESFPAGYDKGITNIKKYLKQFKLLFSPKTKAYESLGGFISIGKIFPSIWNWRAFWELTAILSLILAIMNILPIPALDGGHVLFLLYEMITRRKPSDKFLEYAQITGMLILLTLLIFANGNDIIKLFN